MQTRKYKKIITLVTAAALISSCTAIDVNASTFATTDVNDATVIESGAENDVKTILPNTLEQLVSADTSFTNHSFIYSDKYKFALEPGTQEDTLIIYGIPDEDCYYWKWKDHVVTNPEYTYAMENWFPAGENRSVYSGCTYYGVCNMSSSFGQEKPLNLMFFVDNEIPYYAESVDEASEHVGFDISQYIYPDNAAPTEPSEGTEPANYPDCLSYKKVDKDEDGTDDYVIITKCDESAVSVDIPAEIDGLPVKEIGVVAFANCYDLESVTIPDSVTTINESAFQSCFSLESISIPDSVTSIGHDAFSYTALLNAQTGVKYADKWVVACDVASDTDAMSAEIKDGTKAIADGAFSGCKRLVSISIPDSVTTIGVNAFTVCGLTSVTVPESVTSIGAAAFSYCLNLADITILNPYCEIYDIDSTICNTSDDGIPGRYFYNGTIHGYSGSTAQAYAEKYGYSFESLSEETPVTTAPNTGNLTIETSVTPITPITTVTSWIWNPISVDINLYTSATTTTLPTTTTATTTTTTKPTPIVSSIETVPTICIIVTAPATTKTTAAAEPTTVIFTSILIPIWTETVTTALPATTKTTTTAKPITTHYLPTTIITSEYMPTTNTLLLTEIITEENTPTTNTIPLTTIITSENTPTTNTLLLTTIITNENAPTTTTLPTTTATESTETLIIVTRLPLWTEIVTTTLPTTTTAADTTTTPEPIRGDVSGNGRIDLQDVIQIAEFMIGRRTFTDEEVKIADYNNDGRVGLQDVIYVAKLILKNNRK